jgi:hypothetical protein
MSVSGFSLSVLHREEEEGRGFEGAGGEGGVGDREKGRQEQGGDCGGRCWEAWNEMWSGILAGPLSVHTSRETPPRLFILFLSHSGPGRCAHLVRHFEAATSELRAAWRLIRKHSVSAHL